MSSSSPTTDTILLQLKTVAERYKAREPGAREQLLTLSQALTASLELPSEAIQRLGWAEVSFTRSFAIQIIISRDFLVRYIRPAAKLSKA